MKRLILMRHAKSSWEDDVADFDRPLNGRGLRDAPRIAEALAQRGWSPDVVIHSAALRTTQTWELMASHFPEVRKVVSSKSLYLGSLPDIQEVVETLPPDCGTSLVIGHNPGWELAVHQLSNQNQRMTTANAALFEIVADNWEILFTMDATWRFVDILRPKGLDS
ncbi:histidine phosphatase family protein [Bremerella sp. JC817]|uniref:SixA phosphatase family protein n=1 Tax=Bremerella sp. JC817 TaxID=3231756 RepID=UPI00345A3854